MRNKRRVTRAHRFLAFVVGIWAVLQGLSGFVMLSGDQLVHLSHRNLYERHTGDLGPGPAMAAALKAVPKAKFAASIVMPGAADGVYRVTVVLDPVKQTQRYVYVDPGTAKVNGTRDPKAGAAAFASRWHTAFLQSPADKILGVAPQQVVGWFGVATVLVLLSGVYIWYWPRVRRWKGFGKVRWQRGGYTAAGDVHRFVGVVALPFLLLVIVTGLNVAFPRQARPLWYAVTPGRDSGKRADAAGSTVAPPTSTPTAGAKPVGLDRAVVAATRAVPHSTPISVSGSGGKPTGVITVKLSHGWDPAKGAEGKGGNATVYVDQFSARPLRVVRPEQKPVFAQLYEYWVFAVHTGSFGTLATRFLWSFLVLSPAALLTTGLVAIGMRRAKRRRRRRRLKAALPALTRSQVKAVIERCAPRDVAAGAVVAQQGAPADTFYVIVNGTVRVTLANSRGVEREIDTMGPGDHFGEMGLLHGGPRTATVSAITRCELLALARPGFDALVAMSVAAVKDLLDAAESRVDNQIASRLRAKPDRKRKVSPPPA